MAASRPSEDPVLMLQADQIVAVEVKKVGGAFIRGAILLVKFESDYFGILIAGVWIVHWDRKQSASAIFSSDCGAQVRGKSSDPALPGQVVADEGEACRQRQFERRWCCCRLRLRERQNVFVEWRRRQ